MVVLNKQQRQNRRHEHRQQKTPQLDSSIGSYVNLIDSIDQPQGVHKMKTTIFSTFLPELRQLQSLVQESTNYDYESAEYKTYSHYFKTRPCTRCSDLSTAISLVQMPRHILSSLISSQGY